MVFGPNSRIFVLSMNVGVKQIVLCYTVAMQGPKGVWRLQGSELKNVGLQGSETEKMEL